LEVYINVPPSSGSLSLFASAVTEYMSTVRTRGTDCGPRFNEVENGEYDGADSTLQTRRP